MCVRTFAFVRFVLCGFLLSVGPLRCVCVYVRAQSQAIVQVFVKLIVARCTLRLIIVFPFRGDRAVHYCNYLASLLIRKSANHYTKAEAGEITKALVS